jgi:hypothetical protein
VTTIVFRDGVLASDSLATRNPWKLPGSTSKLFRMSDGGMAGVTGDYAPSVRYVEWLNGPQETDEPSLGDATVVRIHPDQTCTVYEAGGSYVEDVSAFCAWGSGMPCALAALYMGASAAEAVAVAMVVDTHSGGDVVTMECEA